MHRCSNAAAAAALHRCCCCWGTAAAAAAAAAGTECRLSTNQRPRTASVPLCGCETIAFVIA